VNAGTEEENRRIVASNGNGLKIRPRKYHGGEERKGHVKRYVVIR
jgi:hypothetical protein